MKKIFYLSILFFLFYGCASSRIVQLSPDTYMITKSSAAGMFANLSALKSSVIEKANSFEKNKER